MSRVPRVFGEYEGDGLEHVDRAKRKIPHVANGGAHDVQGSRSRLRHTTFHGIWSNSPADWKMCRRSYVSSRNSSSGGASSAPFAVQRTSRIQAATPRV